MAEDTTGQVPAGRRGHCGTCDIMFVCEVSAADPCAGCCNCVGRCIGQPDGIATDSHDYPDPARAAERILAYVAVFGDGLCDIGDGNPLYSRDLESVAKAVTGRTVVDLPKPDNGDDSWYVGELDIHAYVTQFGDPNVALSPWTEFSARLARGLATALLAAAARAEDLATEQGAEEVPS